MLRYFDSQQSSILRGLKAIFRYQGACCIIWYDYPWSWPKIFYGSKPSVFFSCPKFSMLALCIDFRLGSWPVCFWLSVCFCICLLICFRLSVQRSAFTEANRIACVGHAFATVPGVVLAWVAALMRVLSAVLVVCRVLTLEVWCWSYRCKVAYFRRIHFRGCIVCPLF